MSLPRSDEYNLAVQNPKSCFSDSDLIDGIVQTNAMGLPFPYSGGFTTTYRIGSGGFNYAVRCFTRDVDNLLDRYKAIDEFIDQNGCKFLVEARYIKLGIKVNGKWYPIIKMKWVDGDLFNTYVAKIITRDKAEIDDFIVSYKKLIDELRNHNIAHGDLQHGNIIVKNDNIFLIDYDGFYLPSIKKLGTSETGHPNYQHPRRKESEFNQDIDNFSSISIYLALMALSYKSELWKKYNNGENILFKKDDFSDPENSELFYELSKIEEIEDKVVRFAHICKGHFDSVPLLKDFIKSKDKYDQIEFTKPIKRKKNNEVIYSNKVFEDLYGGESAEKTVSGFKYESTQTLKNNIKKNNSSTDDILNFIFGFVVVMVMAAIIIIIIVFNFGGGVDSDAPDTINDSITVNSASVTDDCEVGSIKNDNDECVTREQDCQDKNGANSTWDGNYCNCKDGFVWNIGKTKCITRKAFCAESYSNSIWDGVNCNCPSGYEWNSSQTACVLKKSNDQICKDTYGYNSVWDGTYCNCEAGYVMNSTQTSCITQNQLCSNKYPNTKWDGKYCDCIAGYYWNPDMTGCYSWSYYTEICERDIGINSYYLGYNENGKIMCE